MDGFVQLIDNEDFKKYIVNEYFTHSKMSDEEKIQEVGSSLCGYAHAMDCYNLNKQDNKMEDCNGTVTAYN